MEGRRDPRTLEVRSPLIRSLLERGELYSRGAEALVYKSIMLGSPVAVKVRVPKGYRHASLDSRLRRNRTLTEAKATLVAVEAGVRAPAVLVVEPGDATLVLEWLPGELLRSLLEDRGLSYCEDYLVEAGRVLAIMHSVDLVHGDYTTSNILVTPTGRVYVIDFGLAARSREEREKAIDVHLFLRSLESTHPEVSSRAYDLLLEGYAEEAGVKVAERMRRLVEEIRLMGRYVEARRRRTVWQP